MKLIEIKNRHTEAVIFSHECENNTMKITVELAVKSNANLENANLENANLYKANLDNAYLYNANLGNANLGNANLENANLGNANLGNANLVNAYLYNAYLGNANLENANLVNANLENANLGNANLGKAYLYNANLGNAIKVPMYCKWTHGITNGNLIHIGCEKRTIEEWDLFFQSDDKLTTERNTTEFKQIEAVYLAYKAYLTHLKS